MPKFFANVLCILKRTSKKVHNEKAAGLAFPAAQTKMIELTKDTILTYLESNEQYPIRLVDAAEWLGYSNTIEGIHAFARCGFVQDVDFALSERSTSVKADYIMTIDCFKIWTWNSTAPNAKKVRILHLQVEQEWQSDLKGRLERLTTRSRGQELCSQVQNLFSELSSSYPLEASAVLKILCGSMGVNTQPVAAESTPKNEKLPLAHRQMVEQSQVMHRIALSFNKHTKVLELIESFTEPAKIARLREEYIKATEENMDLLKEVATLKTKAMSIEEVDALISGYESRISELEESVQYWQDKASQRSSSSYTSDDFMYPALPLGSDDSESLALPPAGNGSGSKSLNGKTKRRRNG